MGRELATEEPCEMGAENIDGLLEDKREDDVTERAPAEVVVA